MYLGKCPICNGKLGIYKSLEIEDFERWDYKCNTKGCMINALEWNYQKKEELIKIYNQSIKLIQNNKKIAVKETLQIVTHKKINECVIKHLKKRKSRAENIHYSKNGIISGVKCSSALFAKKATNNKKEVTCSRCKSKLKII